MERINRQNHCDLDLLNNRISRSLTVSTHLSPEQRMNRLIFAQENQNRNWDNVIFSDEKICHCYRIHSPRRIDRISAGIWGWISRDGPGEMASVTERMNSVQYCEILEDVLIPSVDIYYGGMQNVVFMQDNNSTHTSAYTNTWFANRPQITTLVAPPNSPDLNPMENVWNEIHRELQSVLPRNRATLEQIIVAIWEKFRGQTGYFQNLYDSMPFRMQEVIRYNGGPTSY